MIYLLDTNTCIGYLKGRAIGVVRRLETVPSSDVFVCSIVKGELFYGAMKSSNLQGTLTKQLEFLDRFVSLPFDDKSALIYGRIRAQLAALGTPIGSNDLLIAAMSNDKPLRVYALANNLTLVTHNISEFSRVEGLQLEDWEADYSQ